MDNDVTMQEAIEAQGLTTSSRITLFDVPAGCNAVWQRRIEAYAAARDIEFMEADER